jgi:hypothetical protein
VRDQVLATLRELEAFGHAREWSGSDQYDALNATRLPRPAFSTPLRRRLLIQAVKRSPLDLRPIVGIPPGQNAVSLAWASSAYARGGFLPDDKTDRRLRSALQSLERLRSPSYDEPCWGYHFDFQSRVFFYPKTEPNVIATVYAGMALLDAYERLHESDLLDRAQAVAHFLMRRVPRTPDPPGAYFGYLVGDRSPIHNSNLHVCSLLARVAALTGDVRMAEASREGVEWSVARQRPDGSWPYGERPNLNWIDNFHTGYVLDALDACLAAGVLDSPAPLYRGLGFYRRELFLDDGTPKYFASGVYPIDMWSVAQAIQTFSIASRHSPDMVADAARVFAFARARMQRRDGIFLFQRRRFWVNRARHMRGVIAPMMLACAHLVAALGRERDQADAASVNIAARRSAERLTS